MLRELKGWAQEELSKYCSINAKNISMLENDKLEIEKKSKNGITCHWHGCKKTHRTVQPVQMEDIQK